MSGHKKTTLLRIRTYARDLEEQQTKSSSLPTSKPAPTAVVKPAPPVATKKNTDTITRSTTQNNPSVPVVFPPLQKDPTETPLAELEKSFTPPEKVPPPKHIPAFHELQKELEHDLNPATLTPKQTAVKKITTLQAQKAASITTKKPVSSPPRETVSLSGGTVITDTKRSEFNFFSALAKSIAVFFDSLKSKASAKKSVSKYTVATPERRKGVIQKATSKTGAVFTADNETLKDAIRRRKLLESQKKTISWSPNTETGYPLLEIGEPTITNVTVTYKQGIPSTPITETVSVPETAVFPPEPTRFVTPEFTPAVTPPRIPPEPAADDMRWQEPAVVEIPNPEPVLATPTPVVQPIQPEPLPPTPAPTPVQVPVSAQPIQPEPLSSMPAITPPLITEPIAPKPITSTPVKRKRPHFLFSRKKNTLGRPRFTELNSNAITLAIAGVIIGIIVIGFSVRGLFIVLSPSTADMVISASGTPILQTSEFASVTVPSASSNSLNQIIESVVSTAGMGITEIRFIDINQQELSPQVLLTSLNTRTNPNFNQSVSTLRLVSLDGQQRGLLFSITNPTTVLGAMLEWEALLYADLASTLGSEADSSQTGKFVDRTINGTDVRILVVNNQEVLTYGFIDRNILLITTDTTQFIRIREAR